MGGIPEMVRNVRACGHAMHAARARAQPPEAAEVAGAGGRSHNVAGSPVIRVCVHGLTAWLHGTMDARIPSR